MSNPLLVGDKVKQMPTVVISPRQEITEVQIAARRGANPALQLGARRELGQRRRQRDVGRDEFAQRCRRDPALRYRIAVVEVPASMFGLGLQPRQGLVRSAHVWLRVEIELVVGPVAVHWTKSFEATEPPTPAKPLHSISGARPTVSHISRLPVRQSSYNNRPSRIRAVETSNAIETVRSGTGCG